jgi:creatinine amidohydrolase
MRMLRLVAVLAAAAGVPAGLIVASTPAQTERAPRTAAQQAPKGIRLADLTWQEATAVLRPDTVVVIPLGAGSTEHGPHLKLGNDAVLADYLTRRVLDASDVAVAPALPYHFSPAFVEYPGSTSLGLETARALTTEVALSLSRFGPRRFYVLNTGISTSRAIQPAARALAAQGILLGYTDLGPRLERASASVRQQEGGTHADEVETSMMLFINPDAVDMRRAVKEYSPSAAPQRLTRTPGGPGAFSASGIWGDPTLATKEKGRAIVETLVAGILDDIEAMRRAPLPSPSTLTPPPAPAPAGAAPAAGSAGPRGCTPGDERAIRSLGEAFTLHWTNADAQLLSSLWSLEGDLVHPDGRTERGRETIRTNRTFLFMQREYRGSRHPLTLGNVRCLNANVAVADGKWELRGVSDAVGKLLPTFEGLSTLVVQKAFGGWLIEAYRYTQKPAAAPMPTLLKRPGFPGGPPS